MDCSKAAETGSDTCFMSDSKTRPVKWTVDMIADKLVIHTISELLAKQVQSCNLDVQYIDDGTGENAHL